MNKRSKIDVLIDVIRLNGALDDLKDELSKFSFDSNIPLIFLNKIDFYCIIKNCIKKNITIDDLVNWMNIVEYRDDIDIEDENVKEFIFELASPEINGKIT